MANISDYLRKILEARYGRDVRGSIHDAISAINEEAVEAVNNSAISAQSAQLSAESANKASSDVAAIKTDIYDTAIPAINQAVADSQAAQVAAETAKEGAETARTDTEALEAQCKIYKDKCENATAGITGGLIPKGTTEYANLPALEDTSVGWLYYISDDFVTTSEFIEGEGFYYPPGTNAYVISVDGTKYWDCMGGEMSGYLMKDDFDSALQESEPEFTEATELTAISSKSKFKVVLGKIAKAITDLISLKSLVGSTDISGVGDGTVTGAVSTLNSNLSKLGSIRALTYFNNSYNTQTITFSKYNTAALIFMSISNTEAILYVYSNGYLVPIKASSLISVKLSSDFKTITVKNNSTQTGYLGIIQSGDAKINIL